MQTFSPTQHPSRACSATRGPGYCGSQVSVSNLVFSTYPGIRDMTTLHTFTGHPLPYTQSLGITSMGFLMSRVQQFTVALACGSHLQSLLTVSHPV